jgi:prefoldin subunit 5
MSNYQIVSEFTEQLELLKKQRDQIDEAIEAINARINSLQEK